jgi:hypothetical protein
MDELNEVAQALHGLCMAQQGQIEALGVMMDAVIGVIGQNLAPLTPELEKYVNAMADIRREYLAAESAPSFEAAIAAVNNGLAALQGTQSAAQA